MFRRVKQCRRSFDDTATAEATRFCDPVLFVKRVIGSGYAEVENELFFRDNTKMPFGEAEKMTEEVVKALGRIGISAQGS